MRRWLINPMLDISVRIFMSKHDVVHLTSDSHPKEWEMSDEVTLLKGNRWFVSFPSHVYKHLSSLAFNFAFGYM